MKRESGMGAIEDAVYTRRAPARQRSAAFGGGPPPCGGAGTGGMRVRGRGGGAARGGRGSQTSRPHTLRGPFRWGAREGGREGGWDSHQVQLLRLLHLQARVGHRRGGVARGGGQWRGSIAGGAERLAGETMGAAPHAAIAGGEAGELQEGVGGGLGVAGEPPGGDGLGEDVGLGGEGGVVAGVHNLGDVPDLLHDGVDVGGGDGALAPDDALWCAVRCGEGRSRWLCE